jgi:phosphoglycerol transferase MdoB-like AlkP superfamily enzyme
LVIYVKVNKKGVKMVGTFNWIVLLWQASFAVSVITLLYGLFKRSWVSMIVSFITSLPVAYYFNGSENGWRLVALIPVVLLIMTIYFWRNHFFNEVNTYTNKTKEEKSDIEKPALDRAGLRSLMGNPERIELSFYGIVIACIPIIIFGFFVWRNW